MKKIYSTFLGLSIALIAVAQPQLGGKPFGLGKQNIPAPAVFKLSPIQNSILLEEDALLQSQGEKSLRFGKDVPVDISPLTHGSSTVLPNGTHVWQLLIKSNGATNINFIFDQYDVPSGAKLFVYSIDGSQVRGAFSEANENVLGNFATLPVRGDQVVIEYSEPASVVGQGKLHLSYIIHGYRDFAKSLKDFNTSGSCNNNVVCPEGDAWANQIRSSVVLLTSNNSRYCSGAAVDNTLHDGTPYILTANHCDPGNTDIFLFNYKSPTCSPTTDGPTTDVVQGCIRRANNAGSDFCLVELTSEIPAEYSAYLSGWSRQNTPPAQAICIHHPDGDVEKISFNTGVTGINTWSNADCWNIPDWEDGTTEPGSSGSPLYNENHQIIGQLFGGDATCSNNVNDNFGRFVTSWDGASANVRLKDWLDPNNTDSMTVSGMEASVPAFALDARLQSILSPVAEYCNESSFVPVVRVRNSGLTTLTSFTLNYQFAGGSLQTFNWSGSMAYNQVVDVTLPSILMNSGAGQQFDVAVNLANGIADDQTWNNSLSMTVNNKVGAGYRFELISDDYPEETSWEIINKTTNQVIAQESLGSVTLGTTNVNLCLANGCYVLRMHDGYGDGICCGSSGNGSYTVFDTLGISIGTGGSFNFSDSLTFCVGPTSLDLLPEEFLVQIFPNPIQDKVSLIISNAWLEENPLLTIYSIDGSQIWKGKLNQSQTILDVSTWANGVYLLQTQSKSRVLSKRIIVQHD